MITIIRKGTPGFTVTGSYHTMGGENLHKIRFEDVELSPENLVVEAGLLHGMRSAVAC